MNETTNYEEMFILYRIHKSELLAFLEKYKINYYEEEKDYYSNKKGWRRIDVWSNKICLQDPAFVVCGSDGFIEDNYLFGSLSVGLDKSILEICFEIKPITVERLRKITMNQLTKWWKKNLKKIEYEISTLKLNDATLHKLIILSKKCCDKYSIDYLKARQDVIWELENIK
jgi:hypothetical protein